MISYNAIATVLFGEFVDKIGKYFNFLRDSLPKADIKIPFRTYLSMVFLSTIMVYLFSLVFFAIITTFLEIKLLHQIVLVAYLPLMIALIAFGVLVMYPYQKVMSRKKNIDINMPFALTHMAAIAESGVPPYMIFKLLSNFDEYGEIAREMKVLVRNIDTFGVDPLTAVREMAEKTPSEELRQVLLGIISATESGGDVKTYIKNAGEQAMFEWRLKREKFMQQLSAYAEFYTGILIAAPLFIIALFAVMNMIQPNIAGFDILTLTKLSIYILVPLLNVGFLLFLRGVEVEM
ncbi:MAG: type II secretion system F family protein [Candidatus Aenigmatarchaeota archaeon]|nr:type II secretion system F family protein [Candidatus Aenigmarchaeota archaeon]